MSSSGLFYRTGEEVRLGDVIRVRGLLWGSRLATVCYIPGLSPPHPDLDYDGVRQWGWRYEDGSLAVCGYDPGNRFGGQPSKRVSLVSRGPEQSIDANERLE